MILYRIAKSLLRKGHGKDLVQLNLVNTRGGEGEPPGGGGGVFTAVVWGAYFNIYGCAQYMV